MIEEAQDLNDELSKVCTMRNQERLKVVSAARSWVIHEHSVHGNKVLAVQLGVLF